MHTALGSDAMGRYTVEDWKAVKERLRLGDSIRGCAERTGVDRNAVLRWSRMAHPPDRMVLGMEIPAVPPACARAERTPKQRLCFEDRCYIAALASAGRSARDIALAVGVHRTTVSRELRRTGGPYDPRSAELDARRKARRPKRRKLAQPGRLRSYVANSLMLKWSPEQISRRIEGDFPGDEGMRVSCETIYQALYVQGYGALRHELGVELSLRTKRRGRRAASRLPAKSRPWLEGAHISLRPPEAADRAVPGHWEGDLVVGSDMSSCLVTLVERRSRFVLLSRLSCRDADTVAERMAQMVEGVPAELRRTLTWDQGAEMAAVEAFKLATGFEVYFCDPHSPWQRPTNENTNGLVREFFPKGTDFREVTDEQVAEAQWLLNNRPRKVLGWKFPSEAMMEVLEEGAMIA